ncbi:hypothetical protein PGT21_013492 [Puccinia graminis f. sp. tritici]|uniref:Uncharacterized protein n=1 Tax=Puccinia graminis f. sp. tritici TaxID=56615 RepID=A0A5B0QUM6_PUCGR|nr:hypothetical protein PGT21_013492 [Puccinia graminis f. sp. tritici]
MMRLKNSCFFFFGCQFSKPVWIDGFCIKTIHESAETIEFHFLLPVLLISHTAHRSHLVQLINFSQSQSMKFIK